MVAAADDGGGDAKWRGWRGIRDGFGSAVGYGGCRVIEWRMIMRFWQFGGFIAAMLDGDKTCYGGCYVSLEVKVLW